MGHLALQFECSGSLSRCFRWHRAVHCHTVSESAQPGPWSVSAMRRSIDSTSLSPSNGRPSSSNRGVGLSTCLELEARSTGSHCGGHASGWLISASLFATLSFVMCGLKPAHKAAATPMRTSARNRDAIFFACGLRRGSSGGAVQGEYAWGRQLESARGISRGPSHVHLRDALREVERHVVHLRGYGFEVEVTDDGGAGWGGGAGWDGGPGWCCTD